MGGRKTAIEIPESARTVDSTPGYRTEDISASLIRPAAETGKVSSYAGRNRPLTTNTFTAPGTTPGTNQPGHFGYDEDDAGNAGRRYECNVRMDAGISSATKSKSTATNGPNSDDAGSDRVVGSIPTDEGAYCSGDERK